MSLPYRLTPGRETVPIVQKDGWAQAPICKGAEISPLSGFEPRAVQVVASRIPSTLIRLLLSRLSITNIEKLRFLKLVILEH